MKNRFLLPLPVLFLCGGASHAATIDNASFEAETFANFPGYVSGNSSITGWTASDNSRVGLNSAGLNPFANNGTIPDGGQVAFIQSTSGTGTNTLTSNSGITGLEVGKSYNLTYRVNSRISAGNLDPEMGLIIGGTKVVRNNVNSVGGSNPYKTVGYTFTATATTMSLAIDSTVSGGGTDETLLLDAFTVTEVTPKFTVSAWDGDATSGISSSLSYTHLYNLGSASGATINGQTFTGVAGGNPTVGGSFSYNMGNAFAGDANNITTGGSAALASDFVFGNGAATLTLEGLNPGETYLTSIFTVGFDASGFGRSSTFGGTSAEGELLTASVNGFGNNKGLRLDYEFTATGTSETISINALEGGASFHTYAFSNAVVPEPSAVSLVGLAGTMLLLRRRRI